MKREIVLSEREIEHVSKKIAASLDAYFKKNQVDLPVFVSVLKGSVNFFVDLTRNIKTDMICDYIQVSSYEGTNSTGAVVLKKDLSTCITDKTVVIVEDIIDTGLTMQYLLDYLYAKYNPKEILVVALFDKKCARKNNLKIDYVGKELNENKFLLGYGLDYKEVFRNVPYVFNAKKEDIEFVDKILK